MLIQTIKTYVPAKHKRFIPVVSALLGIVFVSLLGDQETIKDIVVQGLTVGLASTGIYESINYKIPTE